MNYSNEDKVNFKTFQSFKLKTGYVLSFHSLRIFSTDQRDNAIQTNGLYSAIDFRNCCHKLQCLLAGSLVHPNWSYKIHMISNSF